MTPINYDDKIRIAFNESILEYPAVFNTAKEHVEGRKVFIKIMQEKAQLDKMLMIRWLNKNTELKYDIPKIN